jgi:two-component system, NtrC family, nitrogen regulation sensor histidine kinase NtrY
MPGNFQQTLLSSTIKKSLLFIFFVGLLFFTVWKASQYDRLEGKSISVLVFIFVNFNIILLLISAFLVGREVIRLILDRKRNLLGSKLRLRLSLAFVGLTAVPLVVVFALASGLLNKALDSLFSSQLEVSKNASMTLARSYYRELQKDLVQISKILTDESQILNKNLLIQSRKLFGLYSITLVNSDLKKVFRTSSVIDSLEDFTEPKINKVHLSDALLDNKTRSYFEQSKGTQFLRSYTNISAKRANKNSKKVVLVISKRLDPEISNSFEVVRDSFEEYSELKLFKNPIRSGYLFTFGLITALLLFGALWFAVQMAKAIVEPIGKLIRGTDEVARGNYDFMIEPGSSDEFSHLISRFNFMAHELKSSRSQIDRDRRFLETLFANLALGVVTLDQSHTVLLANKVAQKLLGNTVVSGSNIIDSVPDVIKVHIQELLDEIQHEPEQAFHTVQFTISNSDLDTSETKILCTAGGVFASDNVWLATVLLLDDVTELSKLQSMEVWKDAARRIAHEIKNPLTPLKLSAQRLQKKFETSKDKVVLETTQTILEHVESIRRLADEFSKFARLPKAELRNCEIGTLVRQLVATYADGVKDISIRCFVESKLPLLPIDPEQIRRVIINILDNAVHALAEYSASNPTITIRVTRAKQRKKLLVAISDNGPGIPEDIKKRIFEPYVTSRISGTGLGLAIVSAIMTEHKGTIEVSSEPGKGAKFSLSFPI